MRTKLNTYGRRGLRFGAITLPALLIMSLLAACGSSSNNSDSSGSSAASSSNPIVLGLVAPKSGALADFGTEVDEGAQIAVDNINASGGVLGRKLQIDWLDDQSTATGDIAAIRSLNSAGHNLMMGFTNSAGCLGALPIGQSLGAAMIGICSAEGTVGTDRVAKNFYAVSASIDAYATSVAQVVASKEPAATDWYEFGFDYVTGHQEAAQFFSTLKAQGVPVDLQSSTYVPVQQTDYTAQVSALAQRLSPAGKDKRALFLGTYGSGTVSFLQEAQQAGLLNDFGTIATLGDYWSGAVALGKNAPTVWDAYDYFYDSPNNAASNKQFVSEFQAKYHKLPFTWDSEGYANVLAFAAAIKYAKSTDPAKVTAAIPSITVDGLTGPFTFDQATGTNSMPVTVTETTGSATAPEGVGLLGSVIVPESTYSSPSTKIP